jgi:hypothetical protein
MEQITQRAHEVRLHMCAYCETMTRNLYCSEECKALDGNRQAEEEAVDDSCNTTPQPNSQEGRY